MARLPDVAARLKVRPPLVERLGRAALELLRFARRKPLGGLGIALVLVGIVLALWGPQLAPYDPWVTKVEKIMKPPDAVNWFGTDALGRDVFSRTIYGARMSVTIGVTALLMGSSVGFFLGVTSAYFGGKYDLSVQRFVDAMIAIPMLILAMALVAALGIGAGSVITALAIVQMPRIARVVRSVTLGIKTLPYVDAARCVGATDLRIILRHVTPNTFAPLIVVATSSIGAIIIAESSLSFLGLGVPLKTVSWGGLMGPDARQFFVAAPWMALGPGFALTLFVFGCNVLGDALRDVLDPKLRGR